MKSDENMKEQLAKRSYLISKNGLYIEKYCLEPVNLEIESTVANSITTLVFETIMSNGLRF